MPSSRSSYSSRYSRRRAPARRGASRQAQAHQPRQSSSNASASTSAYFRKSNSLYGVSRRQPSRTGSRASSRIPVSSPVIRESDDDDDLNEIILAVNSTGKSAIGCSYYNASMEALYVTSDMKSGDKELVERLKTTIDPTVVLLSTRADDFLLECFDPSGVSLTPEGSDPYALPYALEYLVSSDFGYEAAMSKLICIPFRTVSYASFSVPGETSRDAEVGGSGDIATSGKQERLLHLTGWLQTDSHIALGCAGAVLSYLQRRRALRFMPGDTAANAYMRVAHMESFTLRNIMHINAETLRALRIMDSEAHPSPHSQGSKGKGSKEGLTIYGLFQHLARTPQGRFKLKQWFLRPSLDVDVVSDRHDAIDVLAKSDNESELRIIAKALKSIVDARQLLIRLKRGIAGGSGKGGMVSRNIWSGLIKFCYHIMSIANAVQNLTGGDSTVIAAKIRETFDLVRIDAVGSLISRVIDFEELAEQNRPVVKAGVDKELDEWKRFYAGVDSLLSEVARELAASMPANLPLELNAVYFPQIGFLVSVSRESIDGPFLWEGGDTSNWQRMFTTKVAAYYKTDEMREMDERFGDMVTQIYEREIELIHDLSEKVLQNQDLLANCSDICADLDCLVALTKGAQQFSLVRPSMTMSNILDIREARHLLQELVVPHYIANSTSLEGGSTDDQSLANGCHRANPAILLMTGPNQSGKSVHLQAIALVAYLAQIGSFIPASAGSVIGISDKILTRIACNESVSRIESSFAADCAQLSLALRNATPRSLLVLDEFGKGTSAVDGASLAAGVLQHLIQLGGAMCPKVLAATHFHEIFQTAGCLAIDNPHLIRFAHMKFILAAESTGSEDEVAYLFELADGMSSRSFGTICASLNGISDQVVHRAQQLIDMEDRGNHLAFEFAERQDTEACTLQDAEDVARKFLEWDADHPGQDELVRDVLASILERSVSVDQTMS